MLRTCNTTVDRSPFSWDKINNKILYNQINNKKYDKD